MVFLCGIMMIAFMVMMVGAVISAANPTGKSIEEAGRKNLKKYKIELIKEQYRKKNGEW